MAVRALSNCAGVRYSSGYSGGLMIVRGLILLLLALSQTARAGVMEFKPSAMETKPGDRLLIRGIDGDVRISAGKAAQIVVKVKQEIADNPSSAVRQSLDEWNFSMQRGEAGIEVSVQSPHTKEIWREILKSGGGPKFHIEIVAPAMPLEMAWRAGQVTLENWSANAQISIQQGQIAVTGGTGDLKAIGQEADIRVKSRAGRVEAESFSGKVVVATVKGNVDVECFNGDASVQDVEGQISLKSFRSPITLSGGKGRIDFETIRGPIKISNFGGDLKGTSDEASVTAKIAGANEVRIVTNTGPVTLDLVNSGASVTATSVEGAITGPPHMRADQLAGQKMMRGRLKGGTDGSVVVRTQSGAIRIR